MSGQQPTPAAGESPTLDQLLQDLRALEALVDDWGEQQQRVVAALRNASDALHAEAFRRLIRVLREEPTAAAALRGAVEDELVYAVLRHLGLLKPALQERLEAALAAVRPSLAGHGGDVELVAVEPPAAVTLRLLGACDGCPAATVTLREGVERAIRDACPEIREIRVQPASRRSDPQPLSIASPFATDADTWRTACALDALNDDTVLAVDVGGQPLLLAATPQGLRCYRNACAHLGARLEQGSYDGLRLTCPHHGFQYELVEGQCLTMPELMLQPVTVRVRESLVEVRL